MEFPPPNDVPALTACDARHWLRSYAITRHKTLARPCIPLKQTASGTIKVLIFGDTKGRRMSQRSLQYVAPDRISDMNPAIGCEMAGLKTIRQKRHGGRIGKWPL